MEITPNKNGLSRRKFLASTAALGLATVVPRHVLGRGFVAPNDKITMINIGCGWQGLAEIGLLLQNPQIEIVGVADPNQQSNDYIGWSLHGMRNRLRTLMDEPTWFEGVTGHPGGRDVMRYVVETFYRKNRPGRTGAIQAHEDYRELLATMRGVDSVKTVPVDHVHAYIAVDCYKKGIHQIMHKPLGNKLHETMKVVDMAKEHPRVATHCMAFNASSNNGINQTKAWIDAGAIGALREIHNWSNRPFWPQFLDLPKERPPIPRGFNWDLWLGPSQMRQFSPKYTHCNFRGWFEFGGGSISDMGIYSMGPVWNALELGTATAVTSRFARNYIIDGDRVPRQVVNTWSFPLAGAFRFEIPYKHKPGQIFFTWHDGGMKPDVPLGFPGNDLPAEGMMFVGERGAIVGGFNGQNPRLIGLSETDTARFNEIVAPAMPNQGEQLAPNTPRWLYNWIENVKGNGKNPGSFEYVAEINETYNLGAVSMMRDGRRMEYDPATRTITNDAIGNSLLHRDTRSGWEFV